MSIEFSSPAWYVLICILIGALYSYVFYRKEKLFNEVNKVVLYTMAFLRFITVCILTFLLLEPLIEIENQIIEKPVLVIAHDNSESLLVNKAHELIICIQMRPTMSTNCPFTILFPFAIILLQTI